MSAHNHRSAPAQPQGRAPNVSGESRLARLLRGPEQLDELARIGFTPGQLAEFLELDPAHRTLVLRILNGERVAYDELDRDPNGQGLARWLLTLPSFVRVDDDSDDD